MGQLISKTKHSSQDSFRNSLAPNLVEWLSCSASESNPFPANSQRDITLNSKPMQLHHPSQLYSSSILVFLIGWLGRTWQDMSRNLDRLHIQQKPSAHRLTFPLRTEALWPGKSDHPVCPRTGSTRPVLRSAAAQSPNRNPLSPKTSNTLCCSCLLLLANKMYCSCLISLVCLVSSCYNICNLSNVGGLMWFPSCFNRLLGVAVNENYRRKETDVFQLSIDGRPTLSYPRNPCRAYRPALP